MDQQRDLQDIRAPVTGASSGIGQAARGGGSIVSMAGQIGPAGGAARGATKATLMSMARSRAAEFSPSGARVHALERQRPPW
jgi:NAD(P)-dependent dehydrogenase (short-subunit alcohol dehydrogenase family)